MSKPTHTKPSFRHNFIRESEGQDVHAINSDKSHLMPEEIEQKTLRSCQFFYVPQTLLICKDPCVLHQPERRMQLLACSRATYAIAPHSMCHSSTVEIIPHFRKDEKLDIAAYATCTVARVACYLQSDIVCLMWQLANVLFTTHDTPGSRTYRLPGRNDVA